MAEILAGGLAIALHELGVDARQMYKMDHEPYYEIWDINKKNLKVLEEAEEWQDTWGWFRGAKGSNMGSAAHFFTINGQFMIGWETVDGNDTYDTLMDYFHKGLSVGMESNIIALAVDLARANGKTVAQLFQTYEG